MGREYQDGSIAKENNKQAVQSGSMNPSNEYPYLQQETTIHSHYATTSIEGSPFPPRDRHIMMYQPPRPDTCFCIPYQIGKYDNTPQFWNGFSSLPPPPPPPPPPPVPSDGVAHSDHRVKKKMGPGFDPPHLSSSISSSLSTSTLITNLQENDIVCGRGATTIFQKGNQTFRNVILKYQTLYLCSTRLDKPKIACKVLKIVMSYGGRFVRRSKAVVSSSAVVWEQLTERKAYQKICQSLRESAPELRRKMLKRIKGENPQHINIDYSSKRNDLTRKGDRLDEKRKKLSPQQGKEEVDEEFDVDNITVFAAV
jgi:hypothetical protein